MATVPPPPQDPSPHTPPPDDAWLIIEFDWPYDECWNTPVKEG